MTDSPIEDVTLHWQRFNNLTQARRHFKLSPCVCLIADTQGTALRVGMAGKGLEPRYRGGTGYALDAAMHGSGNQIYVAPVEGALVKAVESQLIYSLQPPYNNQGKIISPKRRVMLVHNGEIPCCLQGASK